MTPWEVHGRELANCNCATGCPCQFMALPTHGTCEAAATFDIDTGYFGDIDLGGTRSAITVKWPGAIHEGNGTMQIIIDESATEAQRDALYKIMTGEETEEMATMWWVFSAMAPTKLETLYRPIEIVVDIKARKGRASVLGVFETVAQPLINPISGVEHRARINLPNGFEFRTAEVAMGTTKTSGAMDLPNNKNSHTHLVELHLSQKGVVEAA